MDDQTTDRASGEGKMRITSTPRERILAGVLGLVYIAGWAFAIYGILHRMEDHWPVRVFVVVFATWFAMMLVLPFVVVCLFFAGVAGSPAWMRGRFSLRALLIAMTLVAVVFGVLVWTVEFFNLAP